MNCRKIKMLLSSYIDGELTKKEADIVKEHIKICHLCRQEIEDLKKIKRLFSYKEKIKLPPFFETRLFNRIYKEKFPVDIFKEFINVAKRTVSIEIVSLVFILAFIFGISGINKNNSYEEIKSYVFEESLSSFEKAIFSESKITNEDVIYFTVYQG